MNAIPVEASVPGENARSEHTSSCIGNNEKQSSDCNERVIQGVKTVDTDIGKTEVSDNNPNTVFDVHPRKMTDTSANLDDIGVMNHHGSISFHTQEMVLKKNDDKRINEAEDESTEVAHKEGV
ncbi:uncharacterized protein LOC106476872, partial [Limulus polyphemus]|uniref:Uncharacterized protein LOC106476872 n=1 Tax=Limulus polyphemus TaxID=6850 RepID=A0ABM1C299_LIMPO